ncbi:MAG TPA: histone deacetylase [Phycisphaerae bacterium]|nr:histone deacetylase [Phycisphaerae bacterium]
MKKGQYGLPGRAFEQQSRLIRDTARGNFHRHEWAIAAAMVACVIAGCAEPRPPRLVCEPRAGHALRQRFCVVYSGQYQINLGGLEKLHPFDINKYSRIYQRLVADGLIRAEDVWVPSEIAREDLLQVHTEQYLDDLRRPAKLAGYLESGFVSLLSAKDCDAGILRPFRYATGGTLLAARLALQYGMAVNIGGGYHHAEPDRGGGFCIYADMPIAIRVLQHEGRIKRALVVDLDVHQGNGTAVCLQGDDDVFTFDMHEEDIYPFPKEHNDLDVSLPRGIRDAEYLDLLSHNLGEVFEKAAPDIVFLQAGADVLQGDPLAHLRLSPDAIVQRDGMVFAEADHRHVPIVMALGGGYSRNAWYVQYRSIRRLIEQYGAEPASQPSALPVAAVTVHYPQLDCADFRPDNAPGSPG